MGMKNSKKLADYILNWKFNSLFVKTLGQLCLLVMVPLCGIIGLSYFVYSNMREEEIRKLSADITNDIAVKWEKIQYEGDQEFSFIGFDSDVELFLFDQELKASFYNMKHVTKLMSLPVLTNIYVSNVCILNYSNNIILDKNGTAKLEEYPYRKMFDRVTKLGERGISVSEPGESQSEQYLIFYWKISEGKKNALFVMQFSIKGLLNTINFQEYGEFYITDGNTILLSNEQLMIGETVDKLRQDEEMTEKNYYINSQKLDWNNVEIMVYIEKSLAKGDLRSIGRFMVFFIVIMFMITLGLAVWISNKLYRPFGEIVRLIRSNDSIPEGEAGFEGKDELEYILKSIEQRVYFTDNVSLEMARRLELLKKAQAIALQSQINPHFINNTLENISYMAIVALGRKNEVSEMVKALADMLRNSLGNTGALVSISEEVTLCERYLKIQSIRYQDKFDVVWDIESEVYGCKIIRIVLQPIIENAIYHGIKHLSVKGMIKIVAKSSGNRVQIEITDNGLGMTEEKKEELLRHMNQDMIQESCHIGLTNVYQRLKLYYGEECEMCIESKLGVGTCIMLRIPKRTE